MEWLVGPSHALFFSRLGAVTYLYTQKIRRFPMRPSFVLLLFAQLSFFFSWGTKYFSLSTLSYTLYKAGRIHI